MSSSAYVVTGAARCGGAVRATREAMLARAGLATPTQIPWRDMPAEYGPWGRVYDLFRRWQRNGTWQRIFTELRARADAKDLITWDLNVDSNVCRAH
ncbi:transposase [Actinomadura sp. 6N118]|uniref:transposase n=1 Tax=Actinomadura sp. 6N118 TaxID=3375151 RepID=UPI0037BC50B4